MQVCQSYAGMSKLCRYVNDNRLCQSFSGMSNLGGNVKLMQVCRTLKKFVKVTRICRSNMGMPRECHTSLECQTFIEMSYFQRNVKLLRECQTSKGMSKSQWNVAIKRECQTFKVMSQ